METNMKALLEEQKEQEKQEDFNTKLDRFKRAKWGGLELEAYYLQHQILLDHHAWVN